MADTFERVMVIVAHPDDAESWVGGTVAKLAREGKTISYVIVTNGDKGSADRSMSPQALARIRAEEQREAAAILGVRHVEFLGYPDGDVEDTRALRLDITRELRRFRPGLVILQNPRRTYNMGASHRDHRIVAGVALDCVYPLACTRLVFPELLPDYEPHRVREVYLTQWDDPQLVVDISSTIDLKAKAFACHRSQIAEPGVVAASVRERAAELGRRFGLAYAESFDRIDVEG
jgi:LmbE family N-acetylglucosaminyl deacetylase